MKAILLDFFMLFSSFVTARERVLEMSESGIEKVRTFKENKRVKAGAPEGEKYFGPFRVIADNTVEIKGNLIPLSSVPNIKSRSALAGISGTTIIYGFPAIFADSMAHMHPQHLQLANGLLIAGMVIRAAGIFFNEFARNQRNDKWSYYKISME